MGSPSTKNPPVLLFVPPSSIIFKIALAIAREYWFTLLAQVLLHAFNDDHPSPLFWKVFVIFSSGSRARRLKIVVLWRRGSDNEYTLWRGRWLHIFYPSVRWVRMAEWGGPHQPTMAAYHEHIRRAPARIRYPPTCTKLSSLLTASCPLFLLLFPLLVNIAYCCSVLMS